MNSNEIDKNDEVIKLRPRVYFTNITFNDGTKLPLAKNSIVVFTGANNCGKSQVLKDLEKSVENSENSHKVVIADSVCEYVGDIDERTFIKEHFFINRDGYYELIGMGYGFDLNGLKDLWSNHRLHSELYRTIIHRLSTEERLTSSNAMNRQENNKNHPIYKMATDSSLADTVSGYFRQAFGVDLVINEKELRTIPLHVGNAPNKKAYTLDKRDEYDRIVASFPMLQDQGDGMRSFASILLNTFTSEYPITLIDEPEAFLHPPQARVLGKMLARHNPDSRQLFISTHSEDFLQGLIDADSDNVTVIRINRDSNTNMMSILRNDKIRELWKNPIMRYSNILSGLFHDKVVVCESDYDCLFYQAIIDAIYEQKKEIAPDILFTHCGGKHRIPDIVCALKAVDVPVAAICDFDLIDDKRTFKNTLSAFGLDWNTSVGTSMGELYESINTKQSKGVDIWSILKATGKAGLSDKEPIAYERVENTCQSIGLFIVPVGELECFDKTIVSKKKEWVYDVLKRYDLANEPKLDLARVFVHKVLEFEHR